MIIRRATPPWVRKLPARMKNGIAMISNRSMPVKSLSATDSIGTCVMVNRYVSTVRPSEIEIGIPVSMRPNRSAKMIQALATSTPASLSPMGRPMRAIGKRPGQRGPGAGWATLVMIGLSDYIGGCEVRRRREVDVFRLDTLDVGDVVVRQLTRAPERPGDLQEAEAHEVRAERDAQVDDPLRQLEVGRHRIGVRDVPDERGAQRADDDREGGARQQAEQHVELARVAAAGG